MCRHETHDKYIYFCDIAVSYNSVQRVMQCMVRCHVINKRVQNVQAQRPMVELLLLRHRSALQYSAVCVAVCGAVSCNK